SLFRHESPNSQSYNLLQHHDLPFQLLPTSETNTSSNVIGEIVNERLLFIANSDNSLIVDSKVKSRIVSVPVSTIEPYDLSISVSIPSFAISTLIFCGMNLRRSRIVPCAIICPLSIITILSESISASSI